MKRRAFLAGLGASYTLGALDWLRYFQQSGVPGTPRELGIAQAAADVNGEPRFLIYWFCEGGWDGYSMFNPVATRNDALGGATAPPAQRIYRPNIPLTNGLYPVATVGTQKVGHLATGVNSLLANLAIVASHHGGVFHSGSRLNYHMGTYNYDKDGRPLGVNLSGKRAPEERSVMQAFAEVHGSAYLLPHISWHNWLADGELSPANYPEGTGYYEKLGPSYAHTVYGNTPSVMRKRIQQIAASAGNGRDARIHKFVDNLHTNFMKDKNSEAVKAFASAVEQHRTLVSAGSNLDLNALFNDATLRGEFGITADDEKTTATSVNDNPARSKNTPNTNVQAMMAHELMMKGVSNAFWIESREIRGFDSHRNRAFVLQNKGQHNQRKEIDAQLWKPLGALVKRLKATEYKGTGKSYWDYTTIVLASEMGRSLGGGDDDVCQHWDTNSVAFMGGSVKGGTQFGGVGTTTLDSIPILPNGSIDPAFDATTGSAKGTKSAQSFVADAGHVYATALELAGVPKSAQKGKNQSLPMTFVKK